MKIAILLFLINFGKFAYAQLDANAISLKFVQSITLDTSKKFNGTKIGGLSGLVYKDSVLYAISDDRGRFGEPRIYSFKLDQSKNKDGALQFELSVQGVQFLFKKTKIKKIYDFEALAPFQEGWIVSSEGDWNAKPRVSPEVIYVEKQSIKQKITLPLEFLPKFEGKQTSGVYNNKAFEGMYFDSNSKKLFLLSESGLLQNSEGDSVFHLLEYQIKNGKFVFDKKSKLDFSTLMPPNSLYGGASEFLKLAEDKFLLLTRAVMPSLSLQYSNTIWVLKRKSDKEKLEVKGKFDLNTGTESEELNQNYEGMAVFELFGKRYLVMVSDDNFNKFEKTVFSFFELEVK